MKHRQSNPVWHCLLLAVVLLLAWGMAIAGTAPEETFDDPELEERYHSIVAELRCLVCQNESIAESNAELARDLRSRTREMLKDGASDEEIKAYMTDRYGDFVLYRPPVTASTMALWAGPAVMLLLASIGLFIALRRRSQMEDEEVSEEEKNR